MPELPEVETVVRGLRPALPGRRITEVHLGKTDFIDEPASLGELLPGRRIAAVERIGKFIRIELTPENGAGSAKSSSDLSLMVHLGMTGRLSVRAPDDPLLPHTHAIFHLDDGRELRYTDIRRFGRILLAGGEAIAELRSRLGQEPLEISADEFVRRLSGRRARIKALLLDQSILRGVGNIYADESLWRARIHPARVAAQLSRSDLLRLLRSLQGVLRAAIESRGSSISDFLDTDGRPGSYQQRHRVYQRTEKPCPRCGTPIRRAVIAGRSSHFCPRCQTAPRGTKRPARKRTARKASRR